MSIFSAIKDAIFGHKAAAPADQTAPVGGDISTAPAATTVDAGPVDVEQVLNDMSANKGNPDLNYQSSIVDLMKLLGLDSSLDSRKQLAQELSYGVDTSDSAKMNIWLHRQVMTKLAANGGKVPSDLIA